MVTDPTSQTLMRTVQPKLGQRAPALWVQAAMTSEMVTLSPDGGGGGPARGDLGGGAEIAGRTRPAPRGA